MLSINVKYFGMLAEAAKLENEVIKINESVTVNDLKSVIIQKHPRLKKMDFQIARNLSIANINELLNDNDEIALLPPFAGG
jgi:molybdopterin synthase sulfur carrier subunit